MLNNNIILTILSNNFVYNCLYNIYFSLIVFSSLFLILSISVIRLLLFVTMRYRKSYLAHSRDSIVSISSIKPIQSLASQVTRRKVTTIKLRKHDAE